MHLKKTILPVFSIIAITALITTVMSSCYYDKEEIIYPDSVCDSSNVSYSRNIVPILSSNCYVCHGGNTPSAAIRLDTYTDLKTQVNNNRFWGAISHSPNYSAMPKNAPMLNSCNLAKIKKWLDGGSPNN